MNARSPSKLNELAVFIPSYNRPEKLLATLRVLAPQLVGGITINILDNCSDQEYSNYCTSRDLEVEKHVRDGKIKFIRNRTNIGMSANFMRAYELCEAEWMWLICDDDAIAVDALLILMYEIERLRDLRNVAFVKFSSRGCEAPKGKKHIGTLTEMIDVLATSAIYFNSFIFLSNGIYRFPHFKEQIRVGYQYLHTYVPHLMMLLDYLDKHKNIDSIVWSEKQVAFYVKPEMGYSYGFVAGLGVGAFKNFGFDLTKRDYLRLENVFAAHNDFKVVIDLFYFARYNANMYVARRLVSNYYVQIKSARNILQRVLFICFTLFLYMPKIFDQLIGILPYVSSSLGQHLAEIRGRYGIRYKAPA